MFACVYVFCKLPQCVFILFVYAHTDRILQHISLRRHESKVVSSFVCMDTHRMKLSRHHTYVCAHAHTQ
jgi:hypothetical protein